MMTMVIISTSLRYISLVVLGKEAKKQATEVKTMGVCSIQQSAQAAHWFKEERQLRYCRDQLAFSKHHLKYRAFFFFFFLQKDLISAYLGNHRTKLVLVSPIC